MRWLVEFMDSSIGRKIRVAVTGILLMAYLVIHLSANLAVLGGPETFNKTAAFMESLPGLAAVELALLLIFAYHIATAIYVTVQNNTARTQSYAVTRRAGGSTAGSVTMIFSGMLLLAFLIVHVYAFRFSDRSDFYQMDVRNLSNKPMALFYLAALGALLLHLSHGFQSAFRTLGLSHPNYTPTINLVGWIFSLAISGGFAVIVISLGFCGGGAS
jgi:succinate dehydrogenase / fumarate reductase, cytochrome b subunit